MNIHEYQAKELLAKFGVPVPVGYAAMSVEEAVAASAKLPGPLYIVKAQIHAGGRGKGKFVELPPEAKGGVRLARSADDVRAAACSGRRRVDYGERAEMRSEPVHEAPLLRGVREGDVRAAGQPWVQRGPRDPGLADGPG